MKGFNVRDICRSPLKLVVVLTATMAMVLPGQTAYADNGGQANVQGPDNRDQAVSRVSLGTYGNAGVDRGTGELNRTVLNVYGGTGDIYAYDGDYSWSAYGSTDCTDVNWYNYTCNTYSVKFNDRALRAASISTLYYYQSLGCHEFGHTGDLGHRSSGSDSDNNSCMRSDIWPAQFDDHDVQAVNAFV